MLTHLKLQTGRLLVKFSIFNEKYGPWNFFKPSADYFLH